MRTLWNNFIYDPIYNALIFIAQNITFQDVGLAVVVLTILIRFILLPLSKKSIVSQYKMKALEPKLKAIKDQKLSKEEEAKATFALYKNEKMNPFSGCLYLLVQLPILFALYFVFIRGVDQPTHLYSFLSTDGLNTMFLGLVDITKPFIPFAILAGITQSIQAILAPKPMSPMGDEGSFQNQFAKSMSVQTKYVLPIIIIFFATKLASAVALYWAVANMFTILQELYFRKSLQKTNI